jgi:hypothetical protein
VYPTLYRGRYTLKIEGEIMIDPIETYNNYVIKEAEKGKEQRKKDNPTSMFAGSSSGLCHRKHWYVLKEQEQKPENVDSLRLMRLGTVMGEDFYEAMDKIDSPDVEIYQETLLKSSSLNVVGHLDLLVVDKETGIGKLYDWKTSNSFKFKSIFSGKEVEISSYHYQLGTYGYIAIEMGLCRAIGHMGLIYYSKNDSQMKELPVSTDMIEKSHIYWKDVMVNTLGEPEFKMGESPAYKWECGKYCNYAHVCPSPLNKEYKK